MGDELDEPWHREWGGCCSRNIQGVDTFSQQLLRRLGLVSSQGAPFGERQRGYNWLVYITEVRMIGTC